VYSQMYVTERCEEGSLLLLWDKVGKHVVATARPAWSRLQAFDAYSITVQLA